MKKLFFRVCALMLALMCVFSGCSTAASPTRPAQPAEPAQSQPDETPQPSEEPVPAAEAPQQSDEPVPAADPQPGHIYLYGEQHSVDVILQRELELWSDYYAGGMRHLFVEYPYFFTAYLNEWMQADDDEILDQLFADIKGTLADSEEQKQFFLRIKQDCPETVFHGTDVGHQYDSTGDRFLSQLDAAGQRESEAYALAREAVVQGQEYYTTGDEVYRENKMTENFIREYDALCADGPVDVMGIYGAAHTGLTSKDFTGQVDCMAKQLAAYYGELLESEDLTPLMLSAEPLDVVSMQVGGREYTASYFGAQDLSAYFPQYKCREFYRLEDAYDDFKDMPTTGDFLPEDNYPVAVGVQQVFVIDYTMTDGSTERRYYRTSIKPAGGETVTVEFTVD